jgi:cyclopropane fatty-acyl-phospholipid synthase-like methyltransferase
MLLDPLDRVGLWLNHKTRLPPLWLRRYVGPPQTFETAAAEFLCLLKLGADLRTDSAVLDIGCGCGALAIQLFDYLGLQGRYLGIDIHRPSVRWCQTHLRRAGFSFEWVDMHSSAYNPRGSLRPDEVRLDGHSPFDVAVAKSLFTHVTPDVLRAYMRLVGQSLSPAGVFVFTAFLFQDARAPEVAQAFPFGDEDCRHAYAYRIESAVAHSEQSVLRAMSDAGLKMTRLYTGAWHNAADPLSFQDVIIARRQV